MLGGGALNFVVVIFSLVEDDSATDNRVGSAKHHKWVSELVLSLVVHAGLDLLEVSEASLEEISVMVSMLLAIWVPHVTGGLTAV